MPPPAERAPFPPPYPPMVLPHSPFASVPSPPPPGAFPPPAHPPSHYPQAAFQHLPEAQLISGSETGSESGDEGPPPLEASDGNGWEAASFASTAPPAAATAVAPAPAAAPTLISLSDSDSDSDGGAEPPPLIADDPGSEEGWMAVGHRR